MELKATNIIESLHQGIQSHRVQDTYLIAKTLAKVLPRDSTLALYGDLGSGKTTFVSGLAQAWGITDLVTSPTFAIMNVYKGMRTLMHIDAYRLTSPAQFEALSIEEWLASPFCLAIEWPEKLGVFLPKNCWNLHFEITSAHAHHLKLR